MATGKTATLWLVILCMVQLLAPASLHAASVSALRVDTISHGVKLSLSIPRQTYPKNALVTVTVRLQNVSRHPVLVSGNNPSTVAVFDSSHQVVYWPNTPFMDQELFDHSVPKRLPIKLAPNKHISTTFFVILWGPFLQAQAMLGAPAKQHDIRGTFVPLTLTNDVAPAVVVTDAPTIHADVTPPPGVSGPLHFVQQKQCTTGNGVSGTWTGWDVATSDSLTPGFTSDCSSNRKWIAYVGWLNHPVATIDYAKA
jgi:hypothetical protein